MHQVLSQGLWTRVCQLVSPKSRIRAAVAYFTSTNGLSFKAGDALIADASHSAIASGQTNAKALSKLYSKGVEIYACECLHAKFLQIGRITIIGSANLSRSSSEVLIEACVATDHPTVLSQSLALFEALKRVSTKLTHQSLEKLLRIPVTPRRQISSSKTKLKFQHESLGSTWLVGVTELDDEAYANEQDEVAKGELKAKQAASDEDADVSWIRFTGNSAFRRQAKPGDSVVQLWTPTGGKKPRKAHCHSPILYRQDVGRHTRFFVEESDVPDIRLDEFSQIAKRAGIKGRLGTSTQRQLSTSQADALFALWSSGITGEDGEEE